MSNINDLIDWFEFSLSDSDKIRVQELDSIRNKDNENEIDAEISQIYDKVSPFSFTLIRGAPVTSPPTVKTLDVGAVLFQVEELVLAPLRP